MATQFKTDNFATDELFWDAQADVSENAGAAGSLAVSRFQTGTGNQLIDGVLSGVALVGTQFTFSFPTSAAQFNNYVSAPGGEQNEVATFSAVTVAEQQAVRAAFGLVSQYTPLQFTEVPEATQGPANFRISNYSHTNPGTGTHGYYPNGFEAMGDVFMDLNDVRSASYLAPAAGNWGFATIMHELGHTLGLKHGQDNGGPGSRAGEPIQQFGPLPTANDSWNYSLMTYRSYQGAVSDPVQGIVASDNPTTYMMSDIAALQAMYGANFNTASTNTTYAWNTTTGEMSINGTGQGAILQAKIFQTIWDGGGTDTYDTSNFTGNQTIDLRPGRFSTFSTAQLVDLDKEAAVRPADGNIANALQFNNDARSLIENATTGGGNDTITGNDAANAIQAGAGNDAITSGAGNDTILGFVGADTVDGGADTDTIVLTATSADLNAATNAQIVNVEAVSAATAGAGVTINLANQTEGFAVTGGGSADTITGGGGADVLTGGAGNDVLSGGAGLDTASFAGARANYFAFTKAVGGVATTTVRDGVGADGTDTLTNVEALGFTGGNVSQFGAQQNLTMNVDGQRFDDVVFRSVSTGQIIFQNMTAGAGTGFDAISNPLPGFTAVGTGDVSGDGKADVFIWNNTSGFIYSVLPGASASPAFGLVAGGINGTYSALGATDINGDGATDLLVREAGSGSIFWQNATNSVWAYVGINIGSDWSYQAAGDVNRDGFADVVIRNTSGLVYVANMANGANSGYIDLGNLTGYQVRAVADVNADGFADVIVQRESDGWTLWRDLSGNAPLWNVASNPVGTTWIVKDTADVSNDGSVDLIYQNTGTGETLYRAMEAGVGTTWGIVSTPLGTDFLVV